MRRLLEERDFPVERDPLLRLGALAPARPCRSAARRSSSRTRRPPIPRASTSPCSRAGATASRALAPRFAAAGALVIDNSSRLAHGPGRAARRQRGEPARARRGAQGHHREPELHDDGRDAGAEGARRRGRPRPGSSSAPTRRCPAAASPAPPSCASRSSAAVAAGRHRQLVHDGSSVDFPAPGEVRPRRSRSTSSRSPATSSTTARTRPTRRRSSATRAARSSSCPTCSCQRHLRARAGVHRALAVDQRRVRASRSRPPSAPGAARGCARRAC